MRIKVPVLLAGFPRKPKVYRKTDGLDSQGATHSDVIAVNIACVIYSDSQNYVYSDNFLLSRPLLQWKKGGGKFGKIYLS